MTPRGAAKGALGASLVIVGVGVAAQLGLAGCSEGGSLVGVAADAGEGGHFGDTDGGPSHHRRCMDGGGGGDGTSDCPSGAQDGASDGAAASDASAAPDAELPGTSMLLSLVVSTGELRPTFDPSVTDYDITSINGIYPLEVTATEADPAAALTIHGAAATSGQPASVTLQPREDLDVTVVPRGSGAPRTYRVHYVPSDLPTWSVTTVPGAGTGPVLFSFISTSVKDGRYAVMVDRAGAPLYYRTYTSAVILENFQQITLPDGTVRYAYNVGSVGDGGWTLGVDHVLDQQFHDVADYQLAPYAAHGVLPAEGHDFLLLEEGHYIAETYARRTVDLSALNPAWSAQAPVMNPVVQEVKDGEVLLEWDAANVPALYAASDDGNAFTATAVSDYLHLNSIAVDPVDQNLLLSFRHADCVVKLDRATGAILWTLGGVNDDFGLTPDQVFSHQHHVRKQPDGSITVFDNGNDLHQTRALRFVLDEATHTVTSFTVLDTRPASDPQSTFMGSVTPVPGGGTFIGWGGWATPDLAPAATEVNASGTPVWTLQLGAPTFYGYRAIPITAP